MRVKSHQLPITMRMATEFTEDSPPAGCRGIDVTCLPPSKSRPPWPRSKTASTCSQDIIFLRKCPSNHQYWERPEGDKRKNKRLESSDETLVKTPRIYSLPGRRFYLSVARTSRAGA